MWYSVIFVAGLGAVFLAIAVTVGVIVVGGASRPALARAMDTIDRVYAPATAHDDLRNRDSSRVTQRAQSVGRAFTPQGATGWLQRWLDYAGNPANLAAQRVMEFQGLGLFLGAGLGLMAAMLYDFGVLATVLFIVGAAAVGFWAPFLVVYNLGIRRQEQIRHELPDGLDLLTVSVEAGLGFDAAMAQAAETMPGPLGGEFARVLQETQMGRARGEALRALAGRTSVTELRTMATAVVQAADLGIPIARVLREQSREMRIKRKQYAEEAARKVPVTITLPLVLCLFPALFIIVIGPGAINIMRAFAGH